MHLLGFQVDPEALHEFRDSGSLSKSIHTQRIPPMLRNAIQLVRAIGERYLWADAICLAQGGGDDMARELDNMAAIYASAKMALVVTD